jgi:serine/threonine protein kinase
VVLDSRDAVLGGGFSDVYSGRYQNKKVAIKKPRAVSKVSNPYAVSRLALCVIFTDSGRQRLCREALIWRQLRHPFILPFLGVDAHNVNTTNLVGLVTPWISSGTLKDVMESDVFDPTVDPYVWVSLSVRSVATVSHGSCLAQRDSRRSGLPAR